MERSWTAERNNRGNRQGNAMLSSWVPRFLGDGRHHPFFWRRRHFPHVTIRRIGMTDDTQPYAFDDIAV